MGLIGEYKVIQVDDRKKYIEISQCPFRLVFEDNEYVGWYYAGDDAVEMLKNEEIRENPRKSEWVPVSEGFPDVGEAVLVCDTREDYVSCWEYYGGYWTKEDSVFPLNEVTHWMPLPEPPKEGE